MGKFPSITLTFDPKETRVECSGVAGLSNRNISRGFQVAMRRVQQARAAERRELREAELKAQRQDAESRAKDEADQLKRSLEVKALKVQGKELALEQGIPFDPDDFAKDPEDYIDRLLVGISPTKEDFLKGDEDAD